MSPAAIIPCSAESLVRRSPASSSDPLTSTMSLVHGGLMCHAWLGWIPKGTMRPCGFSSDLPALSQRNVFSLHFLIFAVQKVLSLVRQTQSPSIQRRCPSTANSPSVLRWARWLLTAGGVSNHGNRLRNLANPLS